MTDLEGLDATIAELLALPLDQFTAARNARVRELREAGEREFAAALQKLRRPPVALWAANQLSRQPDILLAVREATTEAQDAQSRGSAGDLRDALGRLQRALDAVASAAAEVLDAAGHSTADAVTLGTREVVRLAALRGGEDWERLVSGTLTYEPEPDLGFGGMPPPRASSEASSSTKGRPKASPKAPPKPSEQDQAHQRRLREARSKAADDARKADQAAKLAARLRSQADDLADRMREAERAALAAEQEAARAQEQATDSRRAADALAVDRE